MFKSSIPNSKVNTIARFTRCDTVFSITMVYEQDDGSILMKNFMQCDPKLPMLARALVVQNAETVTQQVIGSLKVYLTQNAY